MSGTYWLDEQAPPLPRVHLHGQPNVAVVGGGVTGCACALALAEAGLRVRVFEARTVAGGASGRNGGFALRGGAMPYDRAGEWIGTETARTYWEWTEGALEQMAVLGGDALQPVGSLRLAADEEERDELSTEYEAPREDGFAAEWREPLQGRVSRFPAAIFHPPDAAIQPARFVRRLAFAAAEAGVEFCERTRVEGINELDADAVRGRD